MTMLVLSVAMLGLKREMIALHSGCLVSRGQSGD
jgi:hypothetical protein